MQSLDIAIHGTLNDEDLPGFPYTAQLKVSQAFTFTNVITDTSTYFNLLVGYIPVSTTRIVVLFLRPSASCLVTLNDSVPDQPMTLTTNAWLGWVRGLAPNSTAAPLVKVKASANPTSIQVIVGIL